MKFITLFFLTISTAIISHSQTLRLNFIAPGTYPEGVAWHPSANLFYVSSARVGTIGKVTAGGKYEELYKDMDIKSAFGMKVDEKNNLLWVCAGDPNYSIYQDSMTHKKMIRLIAIDLKSGKKVKDIDLSNVYKGYHFANDLTMDNQGNIYITDSYSPVIYRVDARGMATVFAENKLFSSAGVGLNGIVMHPDGYLIVANNGSGALLKVPINSPGNVSAVKINQFFPGADGLLLDQQNNL